MFTCAHTHTSTKAPAHVRALCSKANTSVPKTTADNRVIITGQTDYTAQRCHRKTRPHQRNTLGEWLQMILLSHFLLLYLFRRGQSFCRVSFFFFRISEGTGGFTVRKSALGCHDFIILISFSSTHDRRSQVVNIWYENVTDVGFFYEQTSALVGPAGHFAESLRIPVDLGVFIASRVGGHRWVQETKLK